MINKIERLFKSKKKKKKKGGGGQGGWGGGGESDMAHTLRAMSLSIVQVRYWRSVHCGSPWMTTILCPQVGD